MRQNHRHSVPSAKQWMRKIFSAVFIVSVAFNFGMAVSSEPDSLEDWLDLGWDYYNLGDIEKAFNTFIQAVDLFPSSAEAHLALAETYIAMGVTERARAEMLKTLQFDDESPIAARAHYLYATSIREENPSLALLHLERAFQIGGSVSFQFDIAHQTRFCRLMITMSGRAESDRIVLHFSPAAFSQAEMNELLLEMEADLYRIEQFCSFDLTEPAHFFIYPDPYALRIEIPESYEWLPDRREYHLSWSESMDFLPVMSVQVIADMQAELNRHSGRSWVESALPSAVTGRVRIMGTGNFADIDCDGAVMGLSNTGRFIGL
ncbi:MAG TPA: tetratricopeptide repeat protein, partial [Firmicutes bacterium]|nr:tetratricopeptide repeat protein [Bacillota bacterium]